MRHKIRIIGVGLLALAGSLLLSSVASGQALKTLIETEVVRCRDQGEPDRFWVDEDGIEHVRGGRNWCLFVGDLEGRAWFIYNYDLDRASGTYFEHGAMVYLDATIFGKNVSGTGHYTGEGIRIEGVWSWSYDDVWHLEDGRLLKLRDERQEGEPILITGILLEPPGAAVRRGPRRR
jgi:hypothetical protein